MLIREIRAPHEGGAELVVPLHEEITLLTGLSPDGQVALADLLAAAVYGRTQGLSGWVDLHGNRIDLDDWAEAVGEELDALDIFVRARDLPGVSAAGGGAAGLSALGDRAMSAALEQARLTVQSIRADLAAAEERAAETAHERARTEATADGADRRRQASAAAWWEPAERMPDGEPELLGLQDRDEALRHAGDVAAARLAAAGETHAAALSERDAAEAVLAAARERVASATEAHRVAMAALASARQTHADAADHLQQAASSRARDLEALQEACREAAARADAARARAEECAAAKEQAQQAADAAEAAVVDGSIGTTSGAPSATGRPPLTPEERVEALEVDLARARAELSLLADFAASNTAFDRDALTSWPGPGEHVSTPDRTDRTRSAEAADELADARAAGRQADELADARAAAREADELASALRADLARRREQTETDSGRRSGLLARRLDLRRRLDELGARLTALPQVAPAEAQRVEEAADRLRNLPTAEQVAMAADVRAEIDRLIRLREEFSGRAAPAWLIDNARQALEEARVELARAEELARPIKVGPEEAAELDVAHAAVTEAEGKSGRRFSGPLARRRLDAALAAQQLILDRIGVPSYGEFLLRTSPLSSDSDVAERLSAARAAMADAEAVWSELHQSEFPEERAALEEQEAKVLARAAALLGPERMATADAPTPTATLVGVREALVDLGTVTSRVTELAASLADLVGADRRTQVPALLTQAERWLAEARGDDGQRQAIEREITLLEADAAAVELELTTLDTEDDAPIAEAEARLADAERAAVSAWSRADAAAQAAQSAAGGEPPRQPDEGHEEPPPPVEDAYASRANAEVEDARNQVAELERELDEARRHIEDGTMAAPDPAAPDPAAPDPAAPDPALLIARDAAESAREEAERAAAEAQAAADAAAAAVDAAAAALEAAAAAEPDPEADPELAQRSADAEAAVAAAERAVDGTQSAVDRADVDLRAAALAAADAAAWVEAAGAELADVTIAADAAAQRLESERREGTLHVEKLLDRRLAEARDAARAAAAADDDARRRLADVRARLDEAEAALSAAEADVELRRAEAKAEGEATPPRPVEPAIITEDAEIYVLSRFASARSVGKFGALPLIFVDPFGELGARARPILDLVARMASAVQVVYISEDPAVQAWAQRLGDARASVLHFSGTPDPVG